MAGDYDAVLVTARCSNCQRVVSASFGELQQTGVFGCTCGTMTRARYAPPVAAAPFSPAGWRNPSDSCHR